MLLGVYFALSSGTVDSAVYDAVLEETGSSDAYEAWIGRVRVVESGALVASALAGGVLAGWTSARLTYFVTVPFVAVAIVAFLRFDEPRLHRAAGPVALRAHLALTLRTMTGRRDVRQALLLAALVAVLSQAVFEFGPLWLVALDAPAARTGPTGPRSSPRSASAATSRASSASTGAPPCSPSRSSGRRRRSPCRGAVRSAR